MSAERFFVGDIGVVFRYKFLKPSGAPLDLSGATLRQFKFKRPDGVALIKTASLVTDGTDGEAQYVTILNDLSVAGAWLVQGYFENAEGFSGHSDFDEFKVVNPIS